MSSALKPVLTQGSPQNPPGSAQINKPMHPQGAQTAYGQPPAHIPPANAHSANYYSLNVPNAPQHYISGNAPASNHPVPASQSTGPQMYSPSKSTTYTGGYQSNLSHSPNTLPPVSQTLPATQSGAAPSEPPAAPAAPEKPQANGTPEAKSPAKGPEPQQNHVAKEKQAPSPPEKTPEKPAELKEKTPPEAAPAPAKATSPPTTVSTNTATTTTAQEQQSKGESRPQSPPNTQSRPKEQQPQQQQQQQQQQKASSTLKLATTPRAPNRKPKPPAAPVPSKPEAPTEQPAKAKTEPAKPSGSPQKASPPATPSAIGKSKRTRVQTQPYQSPLPELEIISKMTSGAAPRSRTDEKLIVFYKNEFLAVRNSEGGFFVCQAVQNIYKTSQKIKIRWMSQDKNDKTGEIYTKDFYDLIDFDCILTNLNLPRIEKGKFRLPPAEKVRTNSILKRALAVESGVATPPSPTEEHPDGLDLSLYTEESQLKKRRGKKRKASRPLRSESTVKSTKKSPEASKVRKVAPRPAKSKPARKVVAKRGPSDARKAAAQSRAERLAKRSPSVAVKSPVVDQKKAKVLAKVARKNVGGAQRIQTPARNARGAKAAAPPPKVQRTTAAAKTQHPPARKAKGAARK